VQKASADKGDVPVDSWAKYMANNPHPRIVYQKNQKAPLTRPTVIAALFIGVSVGLVAGMWVGWESSYRATLPSTGVPTRYEDENTKHVFASLHKCSCTYAAHTYTCEC